MPNILVVEGGEDDYGQDDCGEGEDRDEEEEDKILPFAD